MWQIIMKVMEVGMDLAANEYEYQATVLDIDNQIENNQRALQDRTAARNQRLSNDISTMRADQAARGVEGGVGIYAGIERTAEADKRADLINTAETIRRLKTQKDMAKTERDIAFHKINLKGAQSFGGMGGAGGAGGK